MKPVYGAAVAQLTAKALWGEQFRVERALFENLSQQEWMDIHSLALRSGVAALVFEGIRRCGLTVPRKVTMRFVLSAGEIDDDYRRMSTVATTLMQSLAEAGIRTMLLKGAGLAALYPKPEMRPCSDIDIYMFGRQREGDEFLHRKWGVNIDEEHHHHTIFNIAGVRVENHYDFIEQHSRRSSGELEKVLKELALTETPAETVIDGQRVLTPSPTLNALFLLRHSGGHFAAEAISVRHLVDWMVFVNRYSQQVDWELVCAVARQCGFLKFFECQNAICIDYLGMNPALVPSRMHEHELVERAWQDTLGYRTTYIPHNFLAGWRYRLCRRLRNLWKQRMVYRDNAFAAFIRSAAIHIIKPKHWRKE